MGRESKKGRWREGEGEESKRGEGERESGEVE
jgi:hypothetical protein